MNSALLGLGSNIEPEYYLFGAATKLRDKFSNIQFSQVYRSSAIGMDGDDFLNACCLLQTSMVQHELVRYCKALEDTYGRDRSKGSWKPRTLDVDLIQWNGEALGDDLVRYAHVFVPAAELLGVPVLPYDASKLIKVDITGYAGD